MIEKLHENSEQAPTELHNEQRNQEPFAWNFAFPQDSKEQKRLEKTEVDRQIINLYDPTGEYEGDYHDQTNDVINATRKDRKMTPAKAVKHIEFAKHFNVKPLFAPLEEQLLKPLVENRIAENNAKLAKEAAQSQDPEVKERKLASLESRQAAKEKSFLNQLESTAEKERKELKRLFGPSWETRHAKFTKEQSASSRDAMKAAGSLATKNLVTPIAEPEQDVVEAPKVEVVQRGSIEEANREASGVDPDQAEIALLAGTAGGGMFGDREAREERLSKWQEEQEAAKDIEGVEVERFDDVQVDKKAIDRSEAQTPITELDHMDSEEAQPKKRNFFKRMNDKVRDLSLGAAVKMTSRKAEHSNDDEKMSRKKKVAIVLAGAVAVGTALYLANQGDDNSRNFLSDMWPFGSNGGGTEHANDIANQTQVPSGSESGTIFGPEMPDTTSIQPDTAIIQPDQPITPPADSVVNSAPQGVNNPGLSPYVEQTVSLKEGMTPSGISAEFVNAAYPNASPEQADALLKEGWHHLIYSNGFTGADTRSMPANTPLDTASMVSHVNELAGKMGLAR